MSIRLATHKDIPDLARIHSESLPDDFLPSLGEDFLEKVYYPAALASSNAVTLVIEVNRSVVGFVTVAHDSDHFTRDVLHGRYPLFAFYALKAALCHPSHILKSVDVLNAALFSRPDPIPGEIVFIAVQASWRRNGFGRKLVGAAMEYLFTKGVSSCRTKTLLENMGVIRMYEEMGWQTRNTIKLIGKRYVILVCPDS